MKNLYAHISNNSTNNPQNSWTNKITKKKKTVTQTFSNLIIQSLELFDWTRSPDNFKTIEKILTTRAPPFDSFKLIIRAKLNFRQAGGIIFAVIQTE